MRVAGPVCFILLLVEPTTIEYGSPSVTPAWSLTRVIAALCMYPLLALACVYGTWVVAALTLGRVPVMYADDPAGINRLTKAMQPVSAILLAMSVPVSLVHVALASSGAIKYSLGGRWDVRRLAWCGAAMVLWGVFWGLVRWDPGRVTDWLMD